MTWRLGAAVAALALAAGPWPELPLWAFVPRALTLAAALWLLRPYERLWVLGFLVVAGFWAFDVASRRTTSPTAFEARFWEKVRDLTGELALAAQEPQLSQLLAGTGAEAEPEKPFQILFRHLRRMPPGVEGLVLADGRGEPVAWVGPRPRLPLRWRPVGERAILPEAWVGEVVLWCREPVYESGRVVGSLLASVPLPKKGSPRLLGVSAGWQRLAVPALAEEDGRPSLGFELRPGAPRFWAASGTALVVTPLLPAVFGLDAAVWLLVAAASAIAVGWLPLGFLPAVVLGTLGLLFRDWRWPWLGPVGAGLAGLAAWALPPLLSELGAPALAPALLPPPLVVLANLVALVALVVFLPPAWPSTWFWLSLPAFFLALATASGVWGALGVVLVALSAPVRGRAVVASLGLAAAFVAGGDGVSRSNVLARTESTLARWGEVRSVARALVASLPEGRLEALTMAVPGERLVLLGELAAFAGLGEVLPGTALVLEDAAGSPVATWGEMGLLGEGEQELAVRSLGAGLSLRLLAPPSPHDVLAALAASGVGVPVAAFDRAGSPISRGAPFRPLPPGVVGEALARERWWGRAIVGNRSLPTYLRVFGDWVLAVPWVRPAPPDLFLLVVGLALWASAPFLLWQVRQRLWLSWQRRQSFATRLRLLAFTTAFLPLLLLANVLPRQWIREREQARQEVARALGAGIAEGPRGDVLASLVRDLGATVAVYRPSFLALTSRPDAALTGGVPMVPPAEAFVRTVRRWREPVVMGVGRVDVFLPVRVEGQNLVVAVLGLAEAAGSRFTPVEWFVITALGVALLSLWAAEALAASLAAPVERLAEAARRLGRGESVPESPEAFRDEEFATLAGAFTTMASEVQARQEELQRQRDLLERVLQNLSAAVLVVEGEVVLLANAVAGALGVERGLSALVASFGPALGEALERAREGAAASARISPRGQADAVWNVTAVPLPGETGRVLLVLEDLSEVARAERLASLTELARIVAHEVKNPLTPIRLWMEELEAALGRSPQDVVEVARAAVTEVLAQVSRLKEVSQGFSNLVALERWEPMVVDTQALAREVVDEYRVLARRGVEVVLHPCPEPLPVNADPLWLRRALRHLLDNSARALGGRAGEITVETRKDGDWAVVAVRDTGGGVAEEHLPRLFEPHFSTTSEGSGLGLAVVFRVCQRAGGRAEARNLPQGLEVRMLLPLSP
ncbi:MAG: ATP-binding protein [Thermoanaerobaculum sp.]